MIAHIEKRSSSIGPAGEFVVIKVQIPAGPSFELRMPKAQYDRLAEVSTCYPETLLSIIADAINDRVV